MYSKELTKGTLQPIILKLLHDKGKMYGYEITQTVKDITRGKIDISEGALYPILHKLEAEGILETEKMYIGKRVRKYYQVTSSGIKAAQQVTDELNNFISTLSTIFKEKEVAK